jgi:hypothetical protein
MRGKDVAYPTAQISEPDFTIACLFHRDLDLLRLTLPRCLDALTTGTTQSFDVVLHCDGTPPEVATALVAEQDKLGIREMRFRARSGPLASGDPSNNGHRRLVGAPTRYAIVFEDDIVMYRTEPAFDVLGAVRGVFERHPEVAVLCTVADSDQWAWRLEDLGEPVEDGISSVNRVATHFIAYDLVRFRQAAQRFGAFELDVFIDREDVSYNWEDLVSHIGVTGDRRIAFPRAWPLHVFHCDRKTATGSMHNTQDPRIKREVFGKIDDSFRERAGTR